MVVRQSSPTSPLITLTTDFGDRDSYVGCMKAVLLSYAPHVRIVDLCHNIQPHNTRHAAYNLWSAFALFPENTIHVVVVDPGVGSERRAIAAQAHDQFFVGPDNGVLWPILEQAPDVQIHQLNDPRWFRAALSSTFHGRDIFAPVAAHIAKGVALKSIGTPLSFPDLCPLQLFDAQVSQRALHGKILLADHFGNLATNIPGAWLPALEEDYSRCIVETGTWRIQGIHRTFSDVEHGQPVAYINSFGLLELAVRDGSAATLYSLSPDQPVLVHW